MAGQWMQERPPNFACLSTASIILRFSSSVHLPLFISTGFFTMGCVSPAALAISSIFLLKLVGFFARVPPDFLELSSMDFGPVEVEVAVVVEVEVVVVVAVEVAVEVEVAAFAYDFEPSLEDVTATPTPLLLSCADDRTPFCFKSDSNCKSSSSSAGLLCCSVAAL